MKNLGVYISVFFLLYGGVIFREAISMDYYSDYGPGPGLLPLWVSGMIIFSSLCYLLVTLKKEIILFSSILPKGEGLKNVIVTVSAFLLFVILVPYTGFVISSTLMLFLMFKRGYKWYWSLGLSAVVTGIVFFVFDVLLQVPLPVNEYGW